MPRLSLISFTAQQPDSAFLPLLHWDLKKFFPFFSEMLCKFQLRFAFDSYTGISWPLNDQVLFLQPVNPCVFPTAFPRLPRTNQTTECHGHLERAGRVWNPSLPCLCPCIPCPQASTFSTQTCFAEEHHPTSSVCPLENWVSDAYIFVFIPPFASNSEFKALLCD